MLVLCDSRPQLLSEISHVINIVMILMDSAVFVWTSSLNSLGAVSSVLIVLIYVHCILNTGFSLFLLDLICWCAVIKVCCDFIFNNASSYVGLACLLKTPCRQSWWQFQRNEGT